MTADKDIYRTAKLYIQQHGTNAWLEAAAMHRGFCNNGDQEGAEIWRRVCEAIAILDDMDKSDTVH